jgi:anti-sigma B factor antagonist
MEIRNYEVAGTLKMHLAGRLDGYWSPQVAARLDTAIQQGHKHIRLNLSELGYLSSAGVQVLVRYYNELAQHQGSLQVSNPSDMVRKVLSLSGLEGLLAASAAVGEMETGVREVAGTRFEVLSFMADPLLKCQVVRPGRNTARQQVSCWKTSLLVGIGGLGANAERENSGPLFAAGGAALCLPAGARDTPDYLVSAAAFTPEVTLQQGMICEGALSVRARFDTGATVAALAAAALDLLGSDMGAMAILGNTDSGEPVMAAGVAVRTPSKLLGSLLQPLTAAQWPSGAFGAAIFSGGPLAAFDGEVAALTASIFTGRFEARVPQRIFSGEQAAAARFAEGCVFAGAISSITGESEL